MQYHIVGHDEGSNITVFIPGQKPLVADSTHLNYDKIVEKVRAGDESVADLFDVAQTAATKFQRLTERVSAASGRLYLDGVEIHDALSAQVVRFLDEGVEDWKPLVNFYETVQQNPEQHSREQLYTWLDKRDFTITPEGMIVGYKGVKKNDDGTFVSISTGKAIVNGVVHTGHIPNPIGAVIEMPRNEVTHDPATGCSSGLHVANYRYAEDFARGARGAVLEVHVNPRDVVSVPTDSEWEKVRVCRYKVVNAIDKPYTAAVTETELYGEGGDYWGDGEEDDYCESCGDELHECVCDEDNESDDPDTDGEGEKNADAPMVLPGYTSVRVFDWSRSVRPGDVFEDRDKRRFGRTFEVERVEGDTAIGKSKPLGLTRKIKVERLLSRKYRKV